MGQGPIVGTGEETCSMRRVQNESALGHFRGKSILPQRIARLLGVAETRFAAVDKMVLQLPRLVAKYFCSPLLLL